MYSWSTCNTENLLPVKLRRNPYSRMHQPKRGSLLMDRLTKQNYSTGHWVLAASCFVSSFVEIRSAGAEKLKCLSQNRVTIFVEESVQIKKSTFFPTWFKIFYSYSVCPCIYSIWRKIVFKLVSTLLNVSLYRHLKNYLSPSLYTYYLSWMSYLISFELC